MTPMRYVLLVLGIIASVHATLTIGWVNNVETDFIPLHPKLYARRIRKGDIILPSGAME